MRKRYWLVFALCSSLAVVAAGINVLSTEWRAGYSSLYLVNQPFNWFAYYKDLAWAKLTQRFFASSEVGVAPVRLYIPARSSAALMESVPASTKKWQPAYMLYPEGRLRKIQVRHRGDNPINWMYEKKSWRIKTKRARMIDHRRKLNYIVLQKEDLLGDYLAYWLGKEVGVLTAQARLVEVFINDESYGLYLEAEHLDESFLRNNGYMPGDIYKGEQYNSERTYLAESDLFNNPAHWTKTAYFNQRPESDHSNLKRFLDLIRGAETSDADFQKLSRSAPFDAWARFSALQILAQSWHNNRTHNMRLVADPWRGTFEPIVHDTGVLHYRANEISLERAAHPLFKLYLQSSPFIVEQYRQLRDLLIDQRVLTRMRVHAESLVPQISRTLSRDPYRSQLIHTLGAHPLGISENYVKAIDWERSLAQIAATERGLIKKITTPTRLRWWAADNGVDLVVDGPVPVESFAFDLVSDSGTVNSVYWDADFDGRISAADIAVPFERTGRQLRLDLTLTANRSFSHEGPAIPFDLTSGRIRVQPTRHRLLIDGSARVTQIGYAMSTDAARLTAENAKTPGHTPTKRNWPVFSEKALEAVSLSGDQSFDRDRIFDRPVRISAGTEIVLDAGVSLIFRNKVEILGAPGAPVIIRPRNERAPFGVVALNGDGVRGSRIRHLEIAGGSGDTVEGVKYIGMLSVHDAQDVVIERSRIQRNIRTDPTYDDTVHVVYSQDIRFADVTIESAVSDALDVDISDVVIAGGRITASGNDGIDAMTSSVLVDGVTIIGSGDKGISVGENSKVIVYGSTLRDNQIGVESKDRSVVKILASDLSQNTKQLNAYSKNWRYGSGGKIEVEKSRLLGSSVDISADKRSEIRVVDSALSHQPKQTKRVEIDASNDFDNHATAKSEQIEILTRLELEEHDLPPTLPLRGAAR